MQIRVANSNKNIIDKAIKLSLHIGGVKSDIRTFMILDDLPFDVILGNRTCKKWKSALTWETDMFEAQPNENDVRRV